jgi:hypothetical protein
VTNPHSRIQHSHQPVKEHGGGRQDVLFAAVPTAVSINTVTWNGDKVARKAFVVMHQPISSARVAKVMKRNDIPSKPVVLVRLQVAMGQGVWYLALIRKLAQLEVGVLLDPTMGPGFPAFLKCSWFQAGQRRGGLPRQRALLRPLLPPRPPGGILQMADVAGGIVDGASWETAVGTGFAGGTGPPRGVSIANAFADEASCGG